MESSKEKRKEVKKYTHTHVKWQNAKLYLILSKIDSIAVNNAFDRKGGQYIMWCCGVCVCVCVMGNKFYVYIFMNAKQKEIIVQKTYENIHHKRFICCANVAPKRMWHRFGWWFPLLLNLVVERWLIFNLWCFDFYEQTWHIYFNSYFEQKKTKQSSRTMRWRVGEGFSLFYWSLVQITMITF